MELSGGFEPGEEPRRISSASTGFWKWVFAPGWLLGMGGVTAAGWLGFLENLPPEGGLILLTALWAGLGSVLIWWSGRIEEVWWAGDDLVVRRSGRGRRIPLSDIREISETRWSRVKTVTLSLRPGHPSGEKIYFLPPFTPLPFLAHPLVKELKREKELAGVRQAGAPVFPGPTSPVS